MERVFPYEHWEYKDPEKLGLSRARFEDIPRWLQSKAGARRYRVAVVRGGCLVCDVPKRHLC